MTLRLSFLVYFISSKYVTIKLVFIYIRIHSYIDTYDLPGYIGQCDRNYSGLVCHKQHLHLKVALSLLNKRCKLLPEIARYFKYLIKEYVWVCECGHRGAHRFLAFIIHAIIPTGYLLQLVTRVSIAKLSELRMSVKYIYAGLSWWISEKGVL